MSKFCHKQVKELAVAFAGELYEELMRDNVLWESWKKSNLGANALQLEQRFIKKNWGKCLEAARATLAGMLALPYDEKMKEEIALVLELDNTLKNRAGKRFEATSRN